MAWYDEWKSDAGSFTGSGKQMSEGDALGGAWSGVKTADKGGVITGIYGGIKDYFKAPHIGGPNKADFQYGGQGEGYFQGWGNQLYNRPAVQAELAQYNQLRGLGLESRADMAKEIDFLKSQRANADYSVAQNQLRQGQDAAAQQALMLAKSGTGGAAAQAAALRNAQGQNAVGAQQLNQQAATLRAQEVQGIQSQIMQAQAQQRAQDLQAQGLDAQTALAQAQLELGSQQLGTQGLLGMMGLGQKAAGMEQAGNIDYWKTRLGVDTTNAQMQQQAKGGLMGLIGTGGAAGIIGLSDVSAKTNVLPLAMSPQPAPMGYAAMAASPGLVEASQGPASPASAGDYAPRTFGGYGPPPEPPEESFSSKYNKFQMATGIGSMIGNAFGANSQIGFNPGATMAPEGYGVVSDQRAKQAEQQLGELKQQNSALETALRAVTGQTQPRQLGRLPFPERGGTGAAPPAGPPLSRQGQMQRAIEQAQPFEPRNELEAEQYGRRWLENKRLEALGDQTRKEQYMLDVANAQAARDLAEQQYAQRVQPAVAPSVAPTPQPVSDERAKMLKKSLDDEQEREFRGWYDKQAAHFNLDRNPDDPRHAYDYRAAWLSGVKPDEVGHWPGEFKAAAKSAMGAAASPATEDFVSSAKARMGEDQDARMSQAFTRAGLDEMERMAVPSRMAPTRPTIVQPNTSALDLAYESEVARRTAEIPNYAWNYRPEAVPEANARQGLPPFDEFGMKRKVGPMAQDLEANPLTAGAVQTGPDGLKRVDAGQLTMTNTGILGELARIQQEQEEKINALAAGRSAVPYPGGR